MRSESLPAILTAREAAHDLRCSVAHVYHAIAGKVRGVSPLPAIAMGRRRLIRREALERWKLENENNGLSGDTIPA
jgi:excisionase family DNA binding protein